jgi:hypothetical protein
MKFFNGKPRYGRRLCFRIEVKLEVAANLVEPLDRSTPIHPTQSKNRSEYFGEAKNVMCLLGIEPRLLDCTDPTSKLSQLLRWTTVFTDIYLYIFMFCCLGTT